ncbi:MAG TPA: HEAT repeat domain-containing protein [Gemmatimonadaceae bacterium]|nr:HEAT repeat domain-containing protein [Gemmatimonadaceae bacterium]
MHCRRRALTDGLTGAVASLHMRLLVTLAAGLIPLALPAQQRAPLTNREISDITTLLRLEDNRRFDSVALLRMLRDRHPEVRRRAALSIGRIMDPAGRALLRTARRDRDTAVAATVVFATAQLYDSAAIDWLDSLLMNPRTPVGVAAEAARAFGLIRTPATRTSLLRFLATAPENASPTVVGEALLSVGRHPRGDFTPVVRWTTSRDVEIRWRATWALFRPRDPGMVARLLSLTSDPEVIVRNWAVRGLTWAQVDTSRLDAAAVRARLRALLADPDRTVRTEALRALGTHPDSASVAAVAERLQDPDAWLSVTAGEALAAHRSFAGMTVPRLLAAASSGPSCATRSVALASINTLSPGDGYNAAIAMSRDTAIQCRSAAVTYLRGMGDRVRVALDSLRNDSATLVSTPARTAYGALFDSLAGRAGGRGRGGGGGGRAGRGAIETGKTDADYRRIVEQWIVPDYNGKARPRAEWVTSRGTIEIELYPGDAPIAVDNFVRMVNAGTIVGTDFSRVVPDFVDQQRGIVGAPLQRDEVNRHRLTRANLSWASAGLDTGRPGYTLNHTVQPHNEGNFTSMGRVVGGMDVVDRIELGDRVLRTRMLLATR